MIYLKQELLSHAPRERVSWNDKYDIYGALYLVTLHVSVWVEITSSYPSVMIRKVTLHVSVWVEIVCCNVATAKVLCHAPRERVSWNLRDIHFIVKKFKSRSTWACELKFFILKFAFTPIGHAPRERVSWNIAEKIHSKNNVGHAPRERVSWN